ncbi:MAG: DUF1846 domain-containing protein [Lachnospiraceae bacterium]|jgi:uncharacterized protein (UPF0371 family)|nr:DUF1846 domain-containing protein [Lachnospiraceae bacterium]
MMTGFDNNLYIKLQSERIAARMAQFHNKLYLELGGKLFDDKHASRVLPGFLPDSKLKMLLELREQIEIIITISAESIAKNKVRGDLGITYDQELLRLMDAFHELDFYVSGVIITHYNAQTAAEKFRQKLTSLGINTYLHYNIDSYPRDVEKIVNDEGFGKNDYFPTSRPLVVITAPGGGSGKMAACLSQLYHEHQRGNIAGYAKFETFPIWNKPLRHPINLAYEAATADLDDINMIDAFHLEAYDIQAVTYNRDAEVFPVLGAIFERIQDHCPYKSPTEMGVNMVGDCIIDDEVCQEAAKQEILRRFYQAHLDMRLGRGSADVIHKLEILMQHAAITTKERRVVAASMERQVATGHPAAAIQLPCGTIITGKTSDLLGAMSAALINTLKVLAGIDHDTHLISPQAIQPIQILKTRYLGGINPRLHTDEILIALSASASEDPNAHRAMEQLPRLIGCEAHSSVILSAIDEKIIRRLGINLTCEPVYEAKRLYYKS